MKALHRSQAGILAGAAGLFKHGPAARVIICHFIAALQPPQA
jgi:hypothetical protein